MYIKNKLNYKLCEMWNRERERLPHSSQRFDRYFSKWSVAKMMHT